MNIDMEYYGCAQKLELALHSIVRNIKSFLGLKDDVGQLILTHFGQATPYDDIIVGQRWLG